MQRSVQQRPAPRAAPDAAYKPGKRSAQSCETGAVMTSLPLVFDAPRRGKPPRHLADLTAAERKAAVEELGLPGYRARQLSTHYFGRLVDDPAQMTDLPAGVRDTLSAALLPSL